LDNAINVLEKNSKVTSNANNDSIKIISKGKILEHPLEYYLEPFTQEETETKWFWTLDYI